MTTGINFWDGSIWTFVTTLTMLLIAMLAAAILRHAFPAIRKLMIPSSVLGGFLILLIGFLYNKLTGHNLFDRALLETLTYHGLGLGFAAMSLRNLDQQSKEYKGDSFRTSISVVSSYLIQGVSALLITILLSYLINSFFASGLLSTMSLISSAQSVAVRCSLTRTRCHPASGSTMAKMLHVPFLTYSESSFLSLPGFCGSGSLPSPSS